MYENIKRLVIHDVGQGSLFTCSQKEAVKGCFLSTFKRNMAPLMGDTRVTLACLVDGLDWEWIAFIKEHPEWRIELHGFSHKLYARLPIQEILVDLKGAKEILEEVFEQKITEYHPTKLKESENLRVVCESLGLDVVNPRANLRNGVEDERFPGIAYSHFWNPRDVERYLEFRRNR